MNSHDSLRRARRTFWVFALVAVAAAGSLSAALDAPAGTVTALRVAVSGLVLIVTIVLAARVMIVLERARRQALGSAPRGELASRRCGQRTCEYVSLDHSGPTA